MYKRQHIIDPKTGTPINHSTKSVTVLEDNEEVNDVLESELRSKGGNILEIASGSGQHALVFANTFSEHIFWPSDLKIDHLHSIEEWRQDAVSNNLRCNL